MAVIDWTTSFPTNQDTVGVEQPDLTNADSDTRISQIHAMRDKLQAVARLVGDDSLLPSSSIRKKLDDLLGYVHFATLIHLDALLTKTGTGLTIVHTGRIYIPANAPEPTSLEVGVYQYSSGVGAAHTEVTIYKGAYPGTPTALDFTATPFEVQTLAWGAAGGTGWRDVIVKLENTTGGEVAYLGGLAIVGLLPSSP